MHENIGDAGEQRAEGYRGDDSRHPGETGDTAEVQHSNRGPDSGRNLSEDGEISIKCSDCSLIVYDGDLWGCKMFFRKFSDRPADHECEFLK